MKKIIVFVGVLNFCIAFGMISVNNFDEGTDVMLLIQREFDLERANADFRNQITVEVREQEREYQQLIESRDQEIERLQAILSETFQRNTFPEDLVVLEKHRRNASQKINELRNNRQEVIIDDPLKPQEVQNTVERINRKRDKIMNRVQAGRMSLEDAREDLNEYISELNDILSKRFDDFRILVEKELRRSHERNMAKLREAYDRQEVIMQHMIDINDSLRRKSEKEEMSKIFALK